MSVKHSSPATRFDDSVRRPAWGVLLGLGFAAGLAIAQLVSPGTHHSWVTDESVRDRVVGSIAVHRGLNPFNIVVAVAEGNVTLTGSVDNAIERELAGLVARAIDGVTHVENRLRVEPDRARSLNHTITAHQFADSADVWTLGALQEGLRFNTEPDDDALVLTVRSQLRWNRTTRALAPVVHSRDGHLTLSGTAQSIHECTTAARIAARIAGVKSVDNLIVVVPAGARRFTFAQAAISEAVSVFGDVWVGTKVRSALLYASDSSGLDLDVAIADGHVALAGVVSNRTELDLAMEVVASVHGVVDIDVSGVRIST